jgi:hypothetical protein
LKSGFPYTAGGLLQSPPGPENEAEDQPMKRPILIALFTLTTALLTAMADDPAPTESKAWKGKSHDEVVALLGEPLKVKKGKDGGKVLIYEGVPRWIIEPALGIVDPALGRASLERESTVGSKERKVKVEYNRDSETDPGRTGVPVESTEVLLDGGAVRDRLKVFLDARGQVFRVKLGKRVFE